MLCDTLNVTTLCGCLYCLIGILSSGGFNSHILGGTWNSTLRLVFSSGGPIRSSISADKNFRALAFILSTFMYLANILRASVSLAISPYIWEGVINLRLDAHITRHNSCLNMAISINAAFLFMHHNTRCLIATSIISPLFVKCVIILRV